MDECQLCSTMNEAKSGKRSEATSERNVNYSGGRYAAVTTIPAFLRSSSILTSFSAGARGERGSGATPFSSRGSSGLG